MTSADTDNIIVDDTRADINADIDHDGDSFASLFDADEVEEQISLLRTNTDTYARTDTDADADNDADKCPACFACKDGTMCCKAGNGGINFKCCADGFTPRPHETQKVCTCPGLDYSMSDPGSDCGCASVKCAHPLDIGRHYCHKCPKPKCEDCTTVGFYNDNNCIHCLDARDGWSDGGPCCLQDIPELRFGEYLREETTICTTPRGRGPGMCS